MTMTLTCVNIHSSVARQKSSFGGWWGVGVGGLLCLGLIKQRNSQFGELSMCRVMFSSASFPQG